MAPIKAIACVALAACASTSAFIAPMSSKVSVRTNMAADQYIDKAKQAREWGEKNRAGAVPKNSDKPKVGNIGKGQPAKTGDSGKPGLDLDAAADVSVMGQKDVDEGKEGVMRRKTIPTDKDLKESSGKGDN